MAAGGERRPHTWASTSNGLKQFTTLTSSMTLTPQSNHLSTPLCPHQDSPSWAETMSPSFMPITPMQIR